MSTLYVIATPIGNLEDMTLRAIRILGEVDMILCEDTRMTKRVLNKYEINTPTLSYHTHSGLAKVEKIVAYLEDGKNVALVSDAGTPGISDPGVRLVSEIRHVLPDTPIVTIPGPSAVTAALSISGLPSSDFLFLGFLPHKKGRQTLFEEVVDSKRTVVLYESPHRIAKTLLTLSEIAPDRKVVVGRELTKIYEEVVSGTAIEVMKYFQDNHDHVRGEFVVMVEGK
ncbi:16S rRNA (cytidine(1402)-2'-O)-methyltransferase [Candidatus Wolfebacteria bacterium]|nr:MAG: 16S rRNA (cytidine(1402)-2'-O)-methyltransferase [Candidatus Wolfebacteria bacterium]